LVEAGADVTRGVPPSEEECERRSRINRARDLKRHLHPGYHGPRRTPQEVALLGTLPDEEVAARTGKTPGAVRQKREELGIPNPAANRWTAEDIALRGTLPDEAVAAARPFPRRRDAEAVPAGDRQPARPQATQIRRLRLTGWRRGSNMPGASKRALYFASPSEAQHAREPLRNRGPCTFRRMQYQRPSRC
jgi:hypothetical protein